MASDHHALDPMRGVLLACGLAWPFTAQRGRRRAACGRRARLAGQHRGVAITGRAGVPPSAGGVRRSVALQSPGTVRGTRPDRSRNAARRRGERDATLPAQNRAERRRVGRAGSRCLRELLDAGGPRPGQARPAEGRCADRRLLADATALYFVPQRRLRYARAAGGSAPAHADLTVGRHHAGARRSIRRTARSGPPHRRRQPVYGTDFRRVYATVANGWLGLQNSAEALNGRFEPFPMF